jgi:prefoldin subunit 5
MYCSSCGATVEDAITVLKRARSQVDEGRSDIDIALRELDDAETNIRRAIRELPEE